MFKRFAEYDDVNGDLDGSQGKDGEGLGVLYLRGPTQTSRDHPENKENEGTFTGTSSIKLPGTKHLKILMSGPPSFGFDVSKMLAKVEYVDSEDCEIHLPE
ncbi:hypothetical protein BGZ80_011198 [Entomortierella chlamydospora]|uniref:Uncharacterized protein n=1 Tax=Entomortierella chlamydospora TaxID=101097 RepID=A0A9P6MTS4_9FUNG|nr:hypothetical protein BGZ80_011198 [Entomortierella chlamydospora]